MAVDCKKEGLNCDKKDICTSVREVMAFFWSAMHVDGKKAAKKSSNKVEKPNRKRISSTGVYGKFWAAVANLEASKSDGGCVVAGSDESNVNRCALGLDHPYLVITASDWNCSDFGKQLGVVMLEHKFTLCLESRGLQKDGLLRLVAFVKSSKALFDSRMNIIIFGEEGCNADIEELCDKYLLMENMLEVGNKDSKIMKIESKSGAEERLKLAQNELTHLQNENSNMKLKLDARDDEVKDLKLELSRRNDELKVKTEELGELKRIQQNWNNDLEVASKERSDSENNCKDLKAKLAVLQKSNDDKSDEKNSLEKLVIEQKKEHKKMSEEHENEIEQINFKILEEKEIDMKRIKDLELRLTLANTESDGRKASVQDQEAQTDSVEISKTPLSALKESLAKNKNQATSAVDQVYRSIRDLKCLMTYTKVNVGLKCDVQIIKGKHVMKCLDLINFSGHGKSQSEAKHAAFAYFIDCVSKT